MRADTRLSANVCSQIGATVTLIAMTEDDLDNVREWRNAPATREKMFTTHLIQPDEHRRWFNAIKKDQTKGFYIARFDNDARGMVSFIAINLNTASAEWGFYKSPNAPKGTGLHLLYAALNFAFNDLKLSIIDSRVLTINPKVLHLHQKLGFIKDENIRYLELNQGDTTSYFAFKLTREQWQKTEPVIKTQLHLHQQ